MSRHEQLKSAAQRMREGALQHPEDSPRRAGMLNAVEQIEAEAEGLESVELSPLEAALVQVEENAKTKKNDALAEATAATVTAKLEAAAVEAKVESVDDLDPDTVLRVVAEIRADREAQLRRKEAIEADIDSMIEAAKKHEVPKKPEEPADPSTFQKFVTWLKS